MNQSISDSLKEVWTKISERYEIYFFEIGKDEDHLHFLIPSAPVLTSSAIL
ncbi:MAG: transposase [Bacteroidia bacterium]